MTDVFDIENWVARSARRHRRPQLIEKVPGSIANAAQPRAWPVWAHFGCGFGSGLGLGLGLESGVGFGLRLYLGPNRNLTARINT